jgi:hypothetical protein
MLTSKRTRRIQRKPDWYSTKVRVHFDRPLSREDAERLVTDPSSVAQHAFLPLISFSKRERRYRRRAGEKKPIATTKFRELAYPSNHDGYVFAFYAECLGIIYEAELAKRGLDNVVIGYRKGSSNIKRASEAFREIQSRGNCVALALDIKGFFDNISHEVLKNCWMSLLGGGLLPPEDHYKVFRALTVAGKIDRADLLTRLGLPSNARDRDLPCPLCSITDFRTLRSAASGSSKLVSKHTGTKGIPQGTPLSAMAANLSMLELDTAVHAIVSATGGSYRRYSDDLLVLCLPEHMTAVEAAIVDALKVHTKTLSLNADKREEARFALSSPALAACSPKTATALQYLGFTFDGQKALIRGGTLSRYYRRMASSVRVAKVRALMVKLGKLNGRTVLHKREVLASHTHLGARSFVSSYAKLSAGIMGPLGAEAIRHQTSGHMRVLNRRLEDKS